MITHPEKVLFPEDGITKGDLASYYASVASLMLPHIRNRPVTLERFPTGIDAKGFFQKDVSRGRPSWLSHVVVPKKEGQVCHALVNDERSLQWLANQNCITPHVWASRVPDLTKPDVCVFDLDPPGDDPGAIRQAALFVRRLLGEFELPSWIKTSGSKGFHIVVPLDGTANFDVVSRFGHGLGALLVKRHPEHLTQEFIKADRNGRILIDTGRTHYGATFAAAYAVRPKPGAPVSAPCTWEEVEQGVVTPQVFSLRSMSDRVARVGDLWADLYEGARSLDRALTKLHGELTEEDWAEAASARRRKPRARKAPRRRRQ